MSTPSRPSGPVTPREQPCGQYTLYEQGHSLSVTVPQTIDLSAGTAISMCTGWYDDHLLYLKAAPVETAPTGQSRATPVADGGERVTETAISGIYTVRDGSTPTLTIPAECDTDQFDTDTRPMLVAGTVEESFAYLKLIPESLYTAGGSIALSDHIEHLESTPTREQRESSVQLSLSTF